jgi:prepilin-type N-terminal cleavage/methylation domain-containing protein
MNKLIKQAFTLIELLVVIAIIGILSGMIVVSMSGVTQKANIAKAQVFANSVRNVLGANMVSEWRFDDNANDTWGVSSGTLYGNASYVSDCVSGKCLSLDGSGDYVDCGSSSNLVVNYISMATWLKMNSYGGVSDTRIISKPFIMNSWPSPYVQYEMIQINGYLRAYFNIGNTIYTVTDSLNKLDLGKWYYAVVTWDGLVPRIYLDGKVIKNSFDAGSPTGVISYVNTTSLFLGTSTMASNFFNGFLDNVQIFNVAIPTSQIKEQYYSGLNKLFVNGGISEEEYLSKVSELAIK